MPDFEQTVKQKEKEYEQGDSEDIVALSELYNIRVRVFEFDKEQKKLYMSFDHNDHEDTINIPLVLLLRHGKSHYKLICDPDAPHQRPLGVANQRSKHETVSLRQLRLSGNVLSY